MDEWLLDVESVLYKDNSRVTLCHSRRNDIRDCGLDIWAVFRGHNDVVKGFNTFVTYIGDAVDY